MLSSPNSSRELLMYSNTLSIAYADRVQVLANCSIQAEQVENAELQSFSPALFYIIVREEINNTINIVPAILCTNKQSTVTNNSYFSRPKTISNSLHYQSIY